MMTAMSNLPKDISRYDELYEGLTGTYWTPPEVLNIDRIHPDVRAELVRALGRRGPAFVVTTKGQGKFEFYGAGTVDMATCISVGAFTIAIDRDNKRSVGVGYSAGELGVTDAMWFSFKGDIDIAFADFYCLARDEGYVL